MGRAVTVTRTEHTAMSLRSLAAKSDDAAQARRLLALAMVLDGASREDAARQAGLDRQTLRDWVHRYNQEGVEGLVSRTPPGAVGKLTQEQRAALCQWVIDGPDPGTNKVIRWRCVDLCGEVRRRFDVTVAERTMSKWLRTLGFTRLQPRPYHRQRDEAAQETFKTYGPPPLKGLSEISCMGSG